jgi:hypothetical protein
LLKVTWADADPAAASISAAQTADHRMDMLFIAQPQTPQRIGQHTLRTGHYNRGPAQGDFGGATTVAVHSMESLLIALRRPGLY